MNNKPSYRELELKIKVLEKNSLLVDTLKNDLEVNNIFLKKLLNTIPNPIFYKSRDGIYKKCNNAFSKRILGISKKEIIGKTLYDLKDYITAGYKDLYLKKVEELFLNRKEQFYEAQVKCSDGIIRDYYFYKSPLIVDTEVLGLVCVMVDVSNYKNALNELKVLSDLSITDHLTSLYNRRHFQEIFEKKLSSLNRHNNHFSFAILDIDFFKDYNDFYGHPQGDIALKEISNVLKNTLNRPNDYVFRIGGEEFAILFEVVDLNNAFYIMEELRKKVENLKISTANKNVCDYMTISIGLGNILKISPNVNNEIIYDEVDKLLYESKESGRNKITVKDIII
ncbi:MAG: diguanylate cyclase [Aliarcobacter sp.]|jgi:diguanylate cyclase (GGDEF)-like protein/PAS domain S-box-containing protein|nr:diguanylate cyclase [Aliarcobacter sp.]